MARRNTTVKFKIEVIKTELIELNLKKAKHERRAFDHCLTDGDVEFINRLKAKGLEAQIDVLEEELKDILHTL